MGIATADAVLTILQRDRILDHVLMVSETLRKGLEQIASRTGGILGIRNAGLFFGIDIGMETSPVAERRAMALDVVNAMRDNGVLISTTGANEDVLKVRPPLVCQDEHAKLFLRSLQDALRIVTSR